MTNKNYLYECYCVRYLFRGEIKQKKLTSWTRREKLFKKIKIEKLLKN